MVTRTRAPHPVAESAASLTGSRGAGGGALPESEPSGRYCRGPIPGTERGRSGHELHPRIQEPGGT